MARPTEKCPACGAENRFPEQLSLHSKVLCARCKTALFDGPTLTHWLERKRDLLRADYSGLSLILEHNPGFTYALFKAIQIAEDVEDLTVRERELSESRMELDTLHAKRMAVEDQFHADLVDCNS